MKKTDKRKLNPGRPNKAVVPVLTMPITTVIVDTDLPSPFYFKETIIEDAKYVMLQEDVNYLFKRINALESDYNRITENYDDFKRDVKYLFVLNSIFIALTYYFIGVIMFV